MGATGEADLSTGVRDWVGIAAGDLVGPEIGASTCETIGDGVSVVRSSERLRVLPGEGVGVGVGVVVSVGVTLDSNRPD